MPNIGLTETIVILGIAFLIFGAKRLPEAARGLGKSFNTFKAKLQDLSASEEPKTPQDNHA